MEAFTAEVTSQKTHLDGLLAEAEDEFEGIKFIMQQQSREAKSIRNRSRYARLRLAGGLVAGGWGPDGSKVLLPLLDSMEDPTPSQPDAKFDHSAFAHWRVPEAEAEQGEIAKGLLKLAEAAGNALEDRKAMLRQSLEQNPKWGGAMCKLDLSLNSKSFGMLSKVGLGVGDTATDGNMPWLVAAKAYHMRWGAIAPPLSGIASTVMPLASCCDMVPMALPLEDVLSLGIAASGIGKFFDTQSGAEYLNEKAVLAQVAIGEAAFAPFGWVCLPLFLDEDFKEEPQPPPPIEDALEAGAAAKKKKAAKSDLGYFMHIPAMQVEWARMLSLAVWTSVPQWNIRRLQKNAKMKMWEPRLAAFTNFVEEVGEVGNA